MKRILEVFADIKGRIYDFLKPRPYATPTKNILSAVKEVIDELWRIIKIFIFISPFFLVIISMLFGDWGNGVFIVLSSLAIVLIAIISSGFWYIIGAIETEKLKATGRWPDPETEDPNYNLIKKLSRLDKELKNGEIDKKTHRLLSRAYRERCPDPEMEDPDFDLAKKLHELDMELEAGNMYKKTYRIMSNTYKEKKWAYEHKR